jgi:hypothetical protein
MQSAATLLAFVPTIKNHIKLFLGSEILVSLESSIGEPNSLIAVSINISINGFAIFGSNIYSEVTRFVISDEEHKPIITNTETLQAAIQEIQANGFVCIDDVISHKIIDVMRTKMLENYTK